MIFETPRLDSIEIEAIGRINSIRKRLKTGLEVPQRWTGFLRRNMLAKAIQGSNTIEGYNVTFEEAVAVVEGERPDIAEQTRRALEGYRTALTYILRLADDPHIAFNEELIRSLHYMMMSYDFTKHPGLWRPGPIFVRREPSGERVYEGPDAEMVPKLMAEFVRNINDRDDSIQPIIRAAMAHLNLVMIHPFSDGNGRMGRAIQTLILARDGILEQPFSSIEEYLGSRGNTEAYYSILGEVGKGSWHPDADARPWIRFCLGAHLQQAITLERRFKEIARLWGDLEVEVAKRKLPDRVIFALYEAAIGFRVRSNRYRIQADVSNQVAARDLRLLVDNKLLLPKGEKRGRTYIASQHLFHIREEAREPRAKTEDVFIRQLSLFDN
jgi:Fic family protein